MKLDKKLSNFLCNFEKYSVKSILFIAPNERAHSGMSFKHTFVRGCNYFFSYLKNKTKQPEAEIENRVAYKKKVYSYISFQCFKNYVNQIKTLKSYRHLCKMCLYGLYQLLVTLPSEA